MTNTETVSTERLEELLRLEIGERDRYLEGTFLWLKHDDKANAFAELITKRTLVSRTPSPAEWQVEATELKMTPVTDGLPVRDELRGEQTILTYCEPVGTWDIVFMEAGWDDFDAGFALGVSHWLDITSMWPGVIAQVASFRAASITPPAPERSKEEVGFLRLINSTIQLMQESGSWDATTMQRVVENIGGLVDQRLSALAKPEGQTQKTWGQWEREQQERERK